MSDHTDELKALFNDEIIKVHCATFTKMYEGIKDGMAECAQAKADKKNQFYAWVGIAGSGIAIAASVLAAPEVAVALGGGTLLVKLGVVGVSTEKVARVVGNTAAATGAVGNVAAAGSTYGTNFVDPDQVKGSVFETFKDELEAQQSALQGNDELTVPERDALYKKLRDKGQIRYGSDKEDKTIRFQFLFDNSQYKRDEPHIKTLMKHFVLREVYGWIPSFEQKDLSLIHI